MKYLSFILIIPAAFTWAIAWCCLFRFGWFRFGFFRNNPKFWDNQTSYLRTKTIGGFKLDGFHLMQSATFGLIFAAIIFYQPVFKWWIDYVIIGGLWIIFFPLLYGFIAPKPKRINDRI